MSDRPLGHNPWFNPVQARGQDRTPNPEHDDDDQKALRAFGRKLDAIMFEADIGGILLLTSKHSMSWMISLPRWSGLTNEGIGLRIRTKMATPEGRTNAIATLGFIADVRDLTFEIHGFFAQLFKQVQRKVEEKGGSIDHPRIGTPGHMGPRSGAKARHAEARDASLSFNPATCVTAAELRSMGVELDPGIPDAAWVRRDSVLRTTEVDDPEMKLQIWEPFRWLPELARDRDAEDPPLINVIRRPAVPETPIT